jgi:UDP-2,3-diacylglucosamine pyrophosphatase LpxH
MRRMVVVISDLHFEEEQSDIIGDPKANHIAFRRNVPGTVFQDMMRDVVNMARSNAASQIDFVLAGDIFDLYRTQLWFDSANEKNPVLPFVDCGEVTAPLEAKLLSILDAISREEDVGKSIAVFQRFANGEYLAIPGDDATTAPFGIPTTLHYLPGNHDRLANATPAIRARIRQLLGLAQPELDVPFPHYVFSDDPPVLIRHGHEYDRYNFGADLSGKQIEVRLPNEYYDKATFGDFNTVMVAARLPNLFCSHFGNANILADPALQAIYCRLLEFDDVRPQSAVLDFFLNTTVPKTLIDKDRNRFPHREALQRYMWTVIQPVARQLLDEISRDPYFRRWIRKLFGFGIRHWSLAGLESWLFAILVRALLCLKPWRLDIPFWLIRQIAKPGRSGSGGGVGNTAETFAAHEKVMHDDKTCFVCAGHTHQPQVAHIFTRNDLKRFFTDTGTWRNAVLAAGDRRSYGRVNATTYVAFYGKHEDPTLKYQPDRGFEYWTGYDQNWPVDHYDQ